VPARFFLPASALDTLIPQSAEAIGVISGLLIQPKGSRTMAKKETKLPAGPPARMNLVTTQVRADAQIGEERIADNAYTHGNPETWDAVDVIESATRSAYQIAQASGRGKEATVAKGRATELICETLLGVCSVELGDEWMHDREGEPLAPREARQAFANHVYAIGYEQVVNSASGRWDRGDRTHSTKDRQISSATALWSGKRADWANALTLYDKNPAQVQAILEPNRRNTNKDGVAGKTMSFEQRSKNMTDKIDIMAKTQCDNWNKTISDLNKAQGDVTTLSKERNNMRAEVTSRFNLDTVVRNKDAASAWNQELQDIIDSDNGAA